MLSAGPVRILAGCCWVTALPAGSGARSPHGAPAATSLGTRPPPPAAGSGTAPALLHRSHSVPVPAPSTLVTVTGGARPGGAALGTLRSPGTPTEPQCNWHAWGAAAGGDTAQNILETCLGCRGSLQKWAGVELISELKLRSQKARPQSMEAEKRHGSAFALAHGEDLTDAAGVSFHLKNWEK